MFIPLSHVATALSVFVSAQLALPSVPRFWVSKPASHHCSAASPDRWAERSTPAKRKAAPGHSSSRSIQIVTFGP